ncbi:MAG: energy transducer TonB [Nitrosomonadales bacterium]|nr:energy transducer TonB [Nitrosomonadales bacterium]
MSTETIKLQRNAVREAALKPRRDMAAANDAVVQSRMLVQQERPRFSIKAMLLVLTIHALALFGLLVLSPVEDAKVQPPDPSPMMVSLVSEPAPEPVPEVVEIIPKPEPKPVIKKTKPVEKVVEPTPIPVPVETAPAPAVAEAEPEMSAPAPAPVVAKQEAPVVQEIPEVKEIIEPPRFGAAYLHNPPPDYPPLSRRVGEEGRVMLRVLVTKDGSAEHVEIEAGSGSSRLDKAALEAVKKWRFIPAKRNNQPISAYVIVPIQFTLNS